MIGRPRPSTRPSPKRLYRQVTLFQDLLGTVNDHATARMLFGDGRSKPEDAEQRAFLDGLLLAEERTRENLRAAFLIPGHPHAKGRVWLETAVPGLMRLIRTPFFPSSRPFLTGI